MKQARPHGLWAVGITVAILAWLATVNLTVVQAETTSDKASVVTISEHSDTGCSDRGLIRWKAVKGVDSYTVIFNDAAYGGAEQRVPVSKPFSGDNPDPSGGPGNVPAGMHQLVWTGATSSPPCGEAPDYSQRLTNARVEYERSGEFIEGTVTGGCQEGSCQPAEGVRISVKGATTKSDTTNAKGAYSIKVKTGDYTVIPSMGKLEFDPDQKKLHVEADSSATANFRIKCSNSDRDDGRVSARPNMKDGCCIPVDKGPGFRPFPESGHYAADSGADDLQIYYDCTANQVAANIDFREVQGLQCEDGSVVDVTFLRTPAGASRLSGRRFTIEQSIPGDTYYSDIANMFIRVSGEFAKDGTIKDARYFVSGDRISKPSRCSKTRRATTMSRVGRDFSPF